MAWELLCAHLYGQPCGELQVLRKCLMHTVSPKPSRRFLCVQKHRNDTRASTEHKRKVFKYIAQPISKLLYRAISGRCVYSEGFQLLFRPSALPPLISRVKADPRNNNENERDPPNIFSLRDISINQGPCCALSQRFPAVELVHFEPLSRLAGKSNR